MAANLIRHFANKLPAGAIKTAANWWLPYRCAGIRINKISPDYRHVEVSMKLKWYNKNYVGTHFGGSIYAMTDPFYMIMLLNNLGRDYIVWDKGATIDFKKPGRGTLTATFQFSQEEIQSIRQQADQNEKYIFDRQVDVLDEQNEIVASIMKTIYVRRKENLTTKAPR